MLCSLVCWVNRNWLCEGLKVPLTISSAFVIVFSCCSVTDEVPCFTLCKSNSYVAASWIMIWCIIHLEKAHNIPFPVHLNILYTQWFLALGWRLDFMWLFNFLHYHIIRYHLCWVFLSPFVCWQRQLQNRTIRYLIQFPRLPPRPWGPLPRYRGDRVPSSYLLYE